MAMMRALIGVIAARPLTWMGLTLGFLLLYYGGLFLSMLLRFGVLPNYVVWHDLAGHYANILAGTPSWSDRVPLMLAEPLFEAGYRNPEYYNIAEWSFLLIPGKSLLMLGVGMVLATFICLRLHGRACAVRSRGDAPVAGVGATLVGMAAATLTWVVCCGSPSWVVILAVLGVGTTTALALEPFGPAFAAAGGAMLLGTLLHQAYLLSRTSQPSSSTQRSTP